MAAAQTDSELETHSLGSGEFSAKTIRMDNLLLLLMDNLLLLPMGLVFLEE